MTVTTRVELPEDAPATRRVHMAAFPGPDEADLVDALRRDPAWLPALSVVAVEEGGLVVGHALLTRLQVGDGWALALAPVAVAPEWQRKGVGRQLVLAALAAAAEADERLVVVVGDQRYYTRFGFTPAFERGITADFPPEHVHALALVEGELPQGHCRYPEPFGAV
ncbi:acetyltransferase [Kitasatospora sp. MMS16-BH015]|uniref:GNAT family N-acetyltransferase n=1 Tax=Kitasatospora sp. MMS16-BH015 TaxID=2018025 RepID=UPI000CA19C87|nr:N-acetyltransferase [Kitasatospora sp. MMS16-BH015]AUG75979.1 acetyltransferase [Kitasatospora sp. MMS16-BH015]